MEAVSTKETKMIVNELRTFFVRSRERTVSTVESTFESTVLLLDTYAQLMILKARQLAIYVSQTPALARARTRAYIHTLNHAFSFTYTYNTLFLAYTYTYTYNTLHTLSSVLAYRA